MNGFRKGRGALLAFALVLTAATAASAAPADPRQRAQALVAQMTQAEKLSLVRGEFPLLMKQRPPGVVVSAGYVPGVPRLGIPALKESDASLGVANAGRADDDATALPSGLALAASFDPDVAYAGGAMIGKEARQKGFNALLAGGVNLVREPRNGRNFEYLGEDPLLAGTLAGASIRGIQSNAIVSTTKHFALNSQETGRMLLDARIDPAALRESDLLAFQIAIETGRPASVMCAYNKLNGVYACENAALFDVLKHDWGYGGWVMSDWGAVHSLGAAMAGLDQESGRQLDRQAFFGEMLKAGLDKGDIPAAKLDDMVVRILTGMAQAGVLDHPEGPGGLETAADGAVAQRGAEAGIVLLKNGGVLPLVRGARTVAVIGGHADAGVFSGGGSSQVVPKGSTVLPKPAWAPGWGRGPVLHPSAPLAAIRLRTPAARFDAGTDPAAAAEAARKADVAIVFASQWTTEGADSSLTLPDGQDALIAAVVAANPRTIVVLETGGPVLMPWLDRAAAVVEAWYPGQKGGEAIARVLYGEIDAAGRLPVTFPAALSQLPRPKLDGEGLNGPEGLTTAGGVGFTVTYNEGAEVGYRWFAKTGAKPLFPFGYGLSYTAFRYGDLRVQGGRALKISFSVTNTGARTGADTPQVYATAAGSTPRLVGFKRVELRPGQTRRISITADPRLLARFDSARPGWTLGGAYAVQVSKAAGREGLSGTASLAPRRLKP